MKHKLNLRNVIAIAICLAATTMFSGCNHEEPFVSVSDITGVPAAATVGTPLTLSGTVVPGNATNKTIVWSVADAGTTGANISGNTLTTTAAGTATIRATVTNGLTAKSNYTQEFTITVTAAGVAPAITTQPTNQTTTVGVSFSFSVEATGTAPLKYQWEFSNDNGATWANSTVATATSATLTYAAGNVPASLDKRQFHCVVSNDYGSVTSNAATLTVKTPVTFTAVQTGGTSGTANSTGIRLTFNTAVSGLTAANITITNGTGVVTKGTLSGSGTTYTIGLTNVTAQGNVTVSVENFGTFTVTNNPQTVAVYRSPFTGDGTSSSQWLITNATELNKLSELINAGTAPYADAGKYYRLENNLNLTIVQNNVTPIGTSSNPFKGNFEGNNKTISGITINRTSDDNGLFGYVDGGIIRNLGLTNVSIKGGGHTGGVAGYIKGSGARITGCFVTGTISGGGSGYSGIGGIAGALRTGAIISDCYTTCSVSGTEGSIGGIVGFGGFNGENCTVTKCYATGAISGKEFVGGIIGTMINGTVSNCVALNPSINRTSGTATSFFRVGDCYVNNNNAALSTMTTNSGANFAATSSFFDNGTGINKDQAKTQSTYTSRSWGWGTTTASPWKWTVGTYILPVFHWQTTAPIAMPSHLN